MPPIPDPTRVITGNKLLKGPIPIVPARNERPHYVPLQPSSISNSLTVVPKALLPFDMNLLVQALADPTVAGTLTNEYPIVRNENSHFIEVEADVTRAMILYITHTVNLIFEDYLGAGRDFTCRTEVSKDRSRVDMRWTLEDTTILIMEVKPSGALLPSEWTEGVGVGNSSQEQLADLKRRIDGMEKGRKSLLVANSGVIMEQVAKYYAAFPCPLFLVFDWESMIILDMATGPNNTTWNNTRHFPRFGHTINMGIGMEGSMGFHSMLLGALLLSAKRLNLI
ncbi:hypothetical protein C8R46DRAFT_1087994 [Mycena filopes]|nr:hypothetical protein C8R46DRAFT_1087994 [Mycena filopes]